MRSMVRIWYREQRLSVYTVRSCRLGKRVRAPSRPLSSARLMEQGAPSGVGCMVCSVSVTGSKTPAPHAGSRAVPAQLPSVYIAAQGSATVGWVQGKMAFAHAMLSFLEVSSCMWSGSCMGGALRNALHGPWQGGGTPTCPCCAAASRIAVFSFSTEGMRALVMERMVRQ